MAITVQSEDQTGAKIRRKLEEIATELPRLHERRTKLDREIHELEELRTSLVRTMDAIGEAVPDVGPMAAIPRRRGGWIRAIDAAVQCTQPGEQLSKHELAKRVKEAGIELRSENPANALATAMTRDRRFVQSGRGVFRREEESEASTEPTVMGSAEATQH